MRPPLFLSLLVLFGCTDSSIYLKNERTGEIVKCGGRHAVTLIEGAVATRESQCIQDYKEQGYVRVPSAK